MGLEEVPDIDNNIDTLLITDIAGYDYQISPDISNYNKLFVGSKEEFTFLSSLFNFPSNSWDTFFDSTLSQYFNNFLKNEGLI